MPYSQSRSPPPLVHPRPSHISQPPPEPITPDPSSPYNPPTRLSVEQARASFDAARQSSEGYTRYSSPPVQGYASGNSFGLGGMPTQTQMGPGAGQGGTVNEYTPAAQSFGSFGMPQTQPHPQQAQPYGTGFAGPSSAQNDVTGGMYNPGMHGAPTQPGQGFQSMMGGLGGWPMGMNEATATMIGKAGQDYVEKNVSTFPPLPRLALESLDRSFLITFSSCPS